MRPVEAFLEALENDRWKEVLEVVNRHVSTVLILLASESWDALGLQNWSSTAPWMV